MTLQAPGGRDDFLFDLSRWNRAGLTRFQYVDGDAAVWLEELRIALLGLYLRGIDPDDRVPEKWRDLFLKAKADRRLQASETEFEAAVTWQDLLTPFPVEIETGGERNQRLLKQYNRQLTDYAWEITRAFARAAHIVLGHQNAYANEGYLRTATQWENLRKLAAMVNYQPTPPASATSTIALELEPDKGVIEIALGLAMKFAPPEGGAPLIFETLKSVFVHPDLSAARTEGWNYNSEPLDFSVETAWIVPKKAGLAQGDLVVITSGNSGIAAWLRTVERDEETGQAKLVFDPTPVPGLSFNNETGNTFLLTEPDGVQLGLPRTTNKHIVVNIDGADSYSAGAIVEVSYTDNGQKTMQAVVVQGTQGLLILETAEPFSGDVTVEAFTPYVAGSSGVLETPIGITTLYYKSTSGADDPVEFQVSNTFREDEDSKEQIAQTHTRPENVSGQAYARYSGRRDTGKVVTAPSVGGGSPDKTVRFEGTPPKSLKQNAWYVARPLGTSDLTPLRVATIRLEADVYYIEFVETPPADHDETEFFGPMTQTLRPVDYNRDQVDAIVGGIADLEGLSPEAQNLVKAGRDVIVVFDNSGVPLAALANLTSVEPHGPGNSFLKITLESEQNFSGWQAGWTRIYLNTVDISHGETKDPKTLGSGDGEKRRQDFQFKITGVSFIPSNASVTGVAPDMDVTVDGVKWEFRDIGDPTAEGQDAWSVALNEDDTLQIHFRRRLPTGTNNLAVSRHRVGVGAKGTGVPPWSMTKPMKKNRFVTGIVQPFITAGGADREPVSDIRDNAPSKLAANGRAVSLQDFGRLCERHSSVWQAKAREVVGPGAVNRVNVVIVPANGGSVTASLESDLIDFVEQRTLPNTKVTITGYQSLALKLHVKVNVDTGRYEKTDVKDAVEAGLVAEFALNNRDLGQPVYVAEILAATERVEGVASATITRFARKSGAPAPLRVAIISGGLAAVFPKEDQVVVLSGVADVTVDVEALA